MDAAPGRIAARATSADGDTPTVRQSSSRRLRDIVDIGYSWLQDGSLPVAGATVTITQTAAATSNASAGGVTVAI